MSAKNKKKNGRARKKRRKASSGTPAWVIVSIVAAAVLLVCGGVGGVFGIWFTRNVDRVARVENRRNNMNMNANRPVAKGKVVFEQQGVLAAGDPRDPTPELQEVKARMKVHKVTLEANKTYVITLRSDAFDAYLRLESPEGKVLDEDDDGGDDFDLDARIDFRPTQPGVYRVIATSWDGMLGAYQLKVQELD